MGVFLFRDREDLYARIDSRVEAMFSDGVVEEVRAAGEIGATAGQTLGLRQIRDLLAGRISELKCIASIQQATRRYAKRQLTWFRRQTSFEPLNLSHTGSSEAIEWIARKARLSFAHNDD
jgi:tRNA dimethylallyltransferase